MMLTMTSVTVAVAAMTLRVAAAAAAWELNLKDYAFCFLNFYHRLQAGDQSYSVLS
jgi:hypothetical protein